MTDTVVIGIAILLAVSLLVRVAPAFVPLPMSERMAERIETVLPVAVFINLAAYCAVSEIGEQPWAGSIAVLSLAALFPLVRRIGLIAIVVIATVIYLAARGFTSVII